jgi:anti-sigma B factor antagonist
MAVKRTASGRITVLEVSGDFTGGDETDRLREAVLAEATAGNTLLVLDLARCEMMNSSGISVLVEAYRNYTARGGEIRLCGMQKRLTNQLATVRLINIFGHHATLDEALAAFAEPKAGA